MGGAEAGTVRRHRRSIRPASIVLGCVVLLIVGWVIACTIVVMHPRVDNPAHADAIVVLGPPEVNGRLQTAQRLLDDHVADHLVISVNSPLQWQAEQLCERPPAGVTVTCFRPEPSTTRGEAEETRRLAAEHGWSRIVVVTSTYHVSRARMIFDRCLADVQMVPATQGISAPTWAYQFFYQSAAFVKDSFESGC